MKMKKNKVAFSKILVVAFAVMILLNLCACGSLVDEQNDFSATATASNKKATIEGDLPCGFMVNFTVEKDSPILDNYPEIKAEEADGPFKTFPTKSFDKERSYYYVNYNSGNNVWTSDANGDIFSGGHVNVNLSGGSRNLEVEEDFIFTYELINSIIDMTVLYYNESTKEIYVKDGSTGNKLSAVTSTLAVTNTKTATETFDGEVIDEASYTIKCILNIKHIDYLTKVQIVEMDKNNQAIKSSELNLEDFVDGKYSLEYETQTNCEYVVIEKSFEKKFVEFSDGKVGDTYVERSFINRKELDSKNYSVDLYFPLGNGFVNTKNLDVKFASELSTDETSGEGTI